MLLSENEALKEGVSAGSKSGAGTFADGCMYLTPASIVTDWRSIAARFRVLISTRIRLRLFVSDLERKEGRKRKLFTD